MLFSILLFAISISADPKIATIAYFNDGHEISPVEDELGTRGGVARIKTVLDMISAEKSDAIRIFGGDLGGGRLFGAVYHGFPMVEAFNAMPIDIASFGQHDFDFGVDVTLDLIQKSKFDWLTTNLKSKDGKPFGGLPTVLTREVGNVKVGFIGLTDAMNTTTPDDRVQQSDLVQEALSGVETLLRQDVDFIVALTQARLEVNIEILSRTSKIDAIFSEESSETETVIHFIGDRPIMMAAGNMGSVVRVDLSRNSTGKFGASVRAYPVDGQVKEDARLKKIQTRYQSELERRLATVIAKTEQNLDAGINRAFECRWNETSIGNLIADAFRSHTGADLAFINGGGIRDNIPKGEILLKNAYAVLPFGNPICMVSLKGTTIKAMLQHGTSGVERLSGRFLQISGGSYSYDWSLQSGERLTDLKINGTPVDDSTFYTVAIPRFLIEGGDGFNMIKGVLKDQNLGNCAIDVEILINHLKANPNQNRSLEGRITVLNRDSSD